ncbi:MAG: hypothetical protein V4760_05815 [Bdellovibrionota bacterium]
MDRLRKHLTIDGAILLIASFTFVVSIGLFFSDGFFGGDGYKGLVAVGKFDLSRNDVRRRVDSGLTWNNVSTPDTVYEGDSVFTGDSSEATVKLDNGAIIKIDPKSLVVIRTRGNKTEIDLQYGSLQGNVGGANGIILTQNGVSQELTSENADIRIVRSENSKDTKVQVMKGDLKIGDKGVKQDEVAELNAKSSNVKKAPITLLAPTSGANLWVPMGASVAFKWKTSGTEEGKFEVSKDTGFADPSFSGSVKGTSYDLAEASRPAGAFYWRIAPTGGEPSLPARLSVFPDVAPLPVLPTEGQEYWIEGEGDTQKSVFFTWEDKAGSTSFKVQVARDEKFSDIVYENVSKSQVDRAQLPKGAYVWRVMGLNSERKNPPWSRLVAFYVKSGSKSPEIPKITSSKMTYEIPRNVLTTVGEADLRAGRGVKPEGIKPFTWETTTNAKSYEVEIAQDETFKNSVRQDTNGSNSFAPSEVKPGSIFVRVRSKGEAGRLSKVSDPARLDVTLPPPKLEGIADKREVFKTEKELKSAKHEFTMKWSPLPWVASYELEWGADEKFEKSKKFNVTETTRSIGVSKSMDYSARVRGLAADGAPMSPWSEVRVGSYKKELFVPAPIAKKPVELPEKRVPAAIPKVVGLSKDIPTPKLREPRPRTSLISLENAPTFVSFKWNPFSSASFYTIQIASDADFANVVTEQKVYRTAYVFEKPLPEGKVYWRVRAHTNKGFSEWSDPADLNVIYQ